jgi:hypothetical protein
VERIIYISTARNEIADADIADILGTSRLNNRRDGLTGLLIVGGRRFLQILEGDSGPLARTYARITADPRHFALVQLEMRAVDKRCCPSWDMGFFDRTGQGESLTDMVERMTETIDDPSLRAHLRGFAELHSRAA